MNFTSIFNQNESNENNSGSLNLKKNDVLNLTKAAPKLNNCMLAAGWDMVDYGVDADLDISAFLLNTNNRCADTIYYNHMVGQGIELKEDNRTGRGDGDDEQIMIDLSQISPSINSIVFNITIYDAKTRHQTFGVVKNAYVRLVNIENDTEICRYSLTSDFSTDTAIIVCSLNRTSTGWEFQAIGEGMVGDLNNLYNKFA